MKSNEGAAPHDMGAAVAALREALRAQAPALRSDVETAIEDRGGGHHILHFRKVDRASVIEAAADRQIHAAFLWQGRPLFAGQFSTASALSGLLVRWVSDQAMPSEMRVEFPGLEIDELADYYERGEALTGEFVRSWDAVEEFYREDSGDYFRSVRTLICALREAGYDRVLRAGQSMSILGLSRSRDQGLRGGQPRLWFDFGATKMDVDANFPPGSLKGHPIQLTSDLRRLLDTLGEQPVN